jgi:Uma2 family endonuclease
MATVAQPITIEQYDRMIEAGIIGEHDRVELIEGRLVPKIGRKRPHIQAGKRSFRALSSIMAAGWHVAKEDPIVVSDLSKPEPDLSVVRGDVDDYGDRDVSASDLALVVEIAQWSLTDDRTVMARIYAASGIPVYWIINLGDHLIEVYSHPDQYSGRYTSHVDYRLGENVPVVIEGREIARIAVADLLPKRP